MHRKLYCNSCVMNFRETIVDQQLLKDLIASLQRRCGLQVATRQEDWSVLPRTRLHVRRQAVLQDSMVAARKEDFDPAKLLQVGMRHH